MQHAPSWAMKFGAAFGPRRPRSVSSGDWNQVRDNAFPAQFTLRRADLTCVVPSAPEISRLAKAGWKHQWSHISPRSDASRYWGEPVTASVLRKQGEAWTGRSPMLSAALEPGSNCARDPRACSAGSRRPSHEKDAVCRPPRRASEKFLVAPPPNPAGEA
jgi:hypothetical protein